MMQQRLIIGSIWGILVGCSIVTPAHSQVVPDGTTNTSVINDCQSSCNIGGGTIAEQNLFHSFQEFNVAPGGSVYFDDPGVANIFSRITGNNPSEIFGTLGVSGGDANLFLLNPNGIVFGEGAALDLNGSFFATTADEIQFGDRSLTTQPNSGSDLALLTIDPSALWFNQLGQNGSIVLDGANLEMPAGQSITLLGKQVGDRPGVLLKNATLDVPEGNVNLGAVGSSNTAVKIDDNLRLQFSSDVVRGDITLKEASKIAVDNSGSFDGNKVNINASRLAIADDSTITTTTIGTGNGANIHVNATESTAITGDNSSSSQQFITNNLTPGGNSDFAGSNLQTISWGTGHAGNIDVTTPDLTLERGAGIVSTTRNQGASGNIAIVADTFNLRNSSLLTGSTTFTSGEVGQIEIETGNLLVEQGGVISSSTLGDGNAGNLTINAADSIAVEETPADSIIPTGIFTNTIFGNGRGGNLNISTPKLILQSGGQLSSSSGAITNRGIIPLGGQGGNISIDAESVEILDRSTNSIFTSGIITDTRGDSPGGNLAIDTDRLTIQGQGFISASSIGTGMGGDIVINARDSIELVGTGVKNAQQLFVRALSGQLNSFSPQGIISFSLFEGDGGNILIDTSQLNLSSGAILTTATAGSDDAGNLEIRATDRIDIIGSVVAAPTFGAGNAGRIDIDTNNLSVAEGATIASASVGSGNAGDLFISATESIEIFNAIPDLLFSSSISTGSYLGLGSSGNMTLNTQRLSVRNGATIQTNNSSFAPANTAENITLPNVGIEDKGRLTIKASESIEISGSASQNDLFGAPANSHISSTTTTSAPASDIQIITPNLSIYDRGAISVNSIGSGAAGTLEIFADNVLLKNEGGLNGTTSSGQGGNIIVQADRILRLKDDSAIDTNAIAEGNGGNIDLTADFVIASENSSISANAAAVGDGGNINLTAKKLFITPDSKITADSELGIDGTVEIDTSLDNEQRSYAELSQKVIQTENKIVSSCGNGDNSQNVFSYTGRGGLPLNPLTELQTNDIVIADFEIPSDTTIEEFDGSRIILENTEPVVEANRWKINADGKVELIATTANNAIASTDFSNCPFSAYK